MAVKVCYSATQLECAVKFIAKNNEYFKGEKDYIREHLLEDIYRMAKQPELSSCGTMGYMLTSEWEVEGIDCDQNTVRVSIYVDPSIGTDRNTEEYKEEIIDV